ncbi:hypothetical protein PENTCL1PPCAC_4570, partial [Pristionchus entomophagus]
PGMFLNVMLLYLIRRFSSRDLGAYKYLLATFATYDIFLIIMHAVIDLRAVITQQLFGVVSYNFLDTSVCTSLYGACFMVPFSLLNIHFLYRYWAIRASTYLCMHSNLCLVSFVPMYREYFEFGRFCICEYGLDTTELGHAEARRNLAAGLNRSSIEGWFVFQREGRISARTIATLLAYDVVMVIMLATSICLAARTFVQIRREKSLSFADRNSQMRILLTLCIQTVVPFVFVYSPFLCFFNLPLLGFRAPSVAAEITPYIHSIFPMLDALVIIIFMRDYR